MSEHDHLVPHPRSEGSPRLTSAEFLQLVVDDADNQIERERRASRGYGVAILALWLTSFVTAAYALAVAKGWVH